MIAQCRELSIDEMLADPIVRALMAADGVVADELELLLRSVAKRISERAPVVSAVTGALHRASRV